MLRLAYETIIQKHITLCKAYVHPMVCERGFYLAVLKVVSKVCALVSLFLHRNARHNSHLVYQKDIPLYQMIRTSNGGNHDPVHTVVARHISQDTTTLQPGSMSGLKQAIQQVVSMVILWEFPLYSMHLLVAKLHSTILFHPHGRRVLICLKYCSMVHICMLYP